MNKTKLMRLLQDFYIATGVRISFWSPDGQRAVVCSEQSDSEFCSLIKDNPALCRQCSQCDQQAINQAMATHSLIIFHCHAGLEEYVYPVLQDENLLGFLMVGQVRLLEDEDTRLAESLSNLVRYGLSAEELMRSYQKLPPMKRASMLSAVRILEAVACYTYLSGLVRLTEPPLLTRLERFIDAHLAEEITLDDLAREMNVSRSMLCHYVRREGGESVLGMLTRKRVEAVCRELISGLTLQDASERCGFSSASYCSKVFKKHQGVSPTAYLASLHGNP